MFSLFYIHSDADGVWDVGKPMNETYETILRQITFTETATLSIIWIILYIGAVNVNNNNTVIQSCLI